MAIIYPFASSDGERDVGYQVDVRPNFHGISKKVIWIEKLGKHISHAAAAVLDISAGCHNCTGLDFDGPNIPGIDLGVYFCSIQKLPFFAESDFDETVCPDWCIGEIGNSLDRQRMIGK